MEGRKKFPKHWPNIFVFSARDKPFQRNRYLTAVGCPKILLAREERKIINILNVNSRITSSKIVKNVNHSFQKNICAEIAKKILRKAYINEMRHFYIQLLFYKTIQI